MPTREEIIEGLRSGRIQPRDESARQELIRRGIIPKTSQLDAALRTGSQGVSLGLGDELAGNIERFRTYFSNPAADPTGMRSEAAYQARVGAARRRVREARTDRPVTSFAAEAAGSLAPGGLAFKAARGVGLAARPALYASQTATSAIHGGASGVTPEERALGAGLGAGLGLGGAAVGEALGLGASIVARQGLDPAARAARLAARAMGDAAPNELDVARRLVNQVNPATGVNWTPAAARREARRLIEGGQAGAFTDEDLLNRARTVHNTPGGPQAMAFEMFPGGQNEARAIQAVRGPGQSIVNRAIDERAAGLEPRFLERAEATFGPQQTRSPGGQGRGRRRGKRRAQSIENQPPRTGYQEYLDRLDIARRGQSGTAYRDAYNYKLTQQQNQQAVERLSGGGFKARARRAAIDRAEEDLVKIDDALNDLRIRNPDSLRISDLENDLADAQLATKALNDIETGGTTDIVNPRALDYYQRGLRHLADAEGGARTEGGRSIAGVRQTFMRSLDSLSPGLREAGEITQRSRGLEKFANLGRSVFRPGKVDEIDDALRSASTTEQRDALMIGTLEAVEELVGRGEVQAVTRLTRNKNWMDMLERLAGDQKKARQLRDFIENAALEVETKRFVQGGSPTTRIAEDIRRLTGEDELGFIGDAVSAAQGGAIPWGIRQAANVYRRLAQPGIRNPQVGAELARMYTQRATLPNMQALAQRLRDAPRSPVFLPGARRNATAGGVGLASILRPAGRVSFAEDR